MLHLRRFVDLVRSLEPQGRQELRLTPQQARDLLADITVLLLELERQQARPRDSGTEVEIQAADW